MTALRVWVFGDSGAASIEEAHAFAAAVEPVAAPVEVAVVDRLSSRARTFARVVAWGVVEPRVVVIERTPPTPSRARARSAPAPIGALLARLDRFPPPDLFGELLRGVACL